MNSSALDRRNVSILVDFGSTFTKVAVVDQENGDILSRTCLPSTVKDDARIGLREALKPAEKQLDVAFLDQTDYDRLKPKSPRFYIDEQCIFYAAGLLSETSQKAAFRLIKKHLKEV